MLQLQRGLRPLEWCKDIISLTLCCLRSREALKCVLGGRLGIRIRVVNLLIKIRRSFGVLAYKNVGSYFAG